MARGAGFVRAILVLWPWGEKRLSRLAVTAWLLLVTVRSEPMPSNSGVSASLWMSALP